MTGAAGKHPTIVGLNLIAPWLVGSLLMIAACHDLSAIPRRDAAADGSSESDGASLDGSAADGALADSGRVDSSLVDAAPDALIPDALIPDAGPPDSMADPDAGAPLLMVRELVLGDDDFFEVREAIEFAAGIFVAGSRRPVDNPGLSQAVVAYVDPVATAWVQSFGLGQNDQVNAAVTMGGEAVAAGLTRAPSAGGDDLLLARYNSLGEAEFFHLGSAANETPFAIAASRSTLVAVGRRGANAAVFDIDDTFETGAALELVFPQDDTALLGVSINETTIVAVGESTSTPSYAVIAVLRRDPDLQLIYSQLLRVDNFQTRLLDVALVNAGSEFVAVGHVGDRALHVRGNTSSAERLEVRVTSSEHRLRLHQVYVDGDGEVYSGPSGTDGMVAHDTGTHLVFSRTPFQRNAWNADLIAGGTVPTLVANNLSETPDADPSDLTRLYFAPLNIDRRPACGGSQRSASWEPRTQGGGLELLTSGALSGAVSLTGNRFDAVPREESITEMGGCPNAP